MAFRIYTKTGDKGMTGLIGGSKIPKSHIRIEAYGTTDELNSYIGLLADLLSGQQAISVLRYIQNRLFVIGSMLACDPDKEIKMQIPAVKEEDIIQLEKEIDRMDDTLPVMKSFILPGGHMLVSHIHIARTVCRRAERCCVALKEADDRTDALAIKYLNRLSDYLFTLARYTGMQLKVQEIPWKGSEEV